MHEHICTCIHTQVHTHACSRTHVCTLTHTHSHARCAHASHPHGLHTVLPAVAPLTGDLWLLGAEHRSTIQHFLSVVITPGPPRPQNTQRRKGQIKPWEPWEPWEPWAGETRPPSENCSTRARGGGTPILPSLRKLRQGVCCEFKANLGYMARSRLRGDT